MKKLLCRYITEAMSEIELYEYDGSYIVERVGSKGLHLFSSEQAAMDQVVYMYNVDRAEVNGIKSMGES